MGLWSLIQNITLYNDNEVLASLRDAGPYMGFRNMLYSNDEEYSLKSANDGSGWGFTIDGISQRVKNSDRNVYNTVEDAVSDTRMEANLRCQDALPFLKAIKFLDARKLRKLRLEIQWNAGAKFVTIDPATPSSLGTILQPTLTVNELINDKALNAIPQELNLPYLNVISENFNIATSGGDDSIQVVNKRLRAFDNKFLNRLLVCNSIANETGGITFYNAVMKQAHSMDSCIYNKNEMAT
ncbi:MAG: hypothetical protein COB29_11435 [Sulfitobacter sp.]|nr:MAG: hypothetical protein COB29_11435 [Sulfitobacter sp.]